MIYLLIAVLMLFASAIFFGAPYLPTLKPQVRTALDLLNLKKGQTMLELGSGDGRVLREAAKRGVNAVGYEINPLLVIISYFVTFRYRKRVTIKWANYWRASWPPADGVFVFLLDKYMTKLDNKIKDQTPTPKKLASFAWKVPGKEAAWEKDGVYLYKY